MSEEEKIQKFFRAYLTQNNIKEDFAQKIIKQAENYEAKNKSKQFLARFFDVMKKCYDGKNPKNYITACKRFLFIINKLLGGQSKKEMPGKYCQIISHQIVQYYLFFFEIIFKNSLHELTIDLKMYRMRWAKRISDSSFIKLRDEIFKKHRFNLDKGFSEQNLEKIRKNHKKRGLSQKQSNFYLGLQSKEQKTLNATKNIEEASSPSNSDYSEDQSGSPVKKIKTDTNDSNMNVTPYSASYPYVQTYPVKENYVYSNMSLNPQMYDPRAGRNSYESYLPLTSAIKGNYYPNEFLKEEIQKTAYSTSSQPMPSSNQMNSSNSYYTPPSYPVNYDKSSYGIPYAFKQIQQLKKQQSNLQKVSKIKQMLQRNLLKCRQCGQFFQTNDVYEKHTTQHFFQSLQKANQAQLKGKVKKQLKMKLFDIKSWETVQKSNEMEYRFQVLLSEVPELKSEKILCFFCNQMLQISFSAKYENWVFADAIKIMDQGHINIMHFNCYECFKSDQNSPISS